MIRNILRQIWFLIFVSLFATRTEERIKINKRLMVVYAPRNSVKYYAYGTNVDGKYFEELIPAYNENVDLYEKIIKTRWELAFNGYFPFYTVAIIYPSGATGVVCSQFEFALKTK